MIYIGNYKNCHDKKCISISGDGGKQVNFKGPRLRELAPKKDWWKIWHDNIGIISEEENLEFYVKSYYETVLKQLDIDEIRDKLHGSILLCYESPEEFCHRDIVAEWFELFFIGEVHEIDLDHLGRSEPLERNKYRDLIREILEPLIKRDIDMHGFNSVKAAHLYEGIQRAEKLRDILPDELLIQLEASKKIITQIENEYNNEKRQKQI